MAQAQMIAFPLLHRLKALATGQTDDGGYQGDSVEISHRLFHFPQHS
jgi:hypothetical protein